MKVTDDVRLQFKRDLLDDQAQQRVIRRMAAQILELQPDLEHLMLVGIRTRGLPLAHRLAAEISKAEGVEPPIGALDITLYRDDLSVIGPQPVVKGTDLPGAIENKVVMLCDDVLYTGRTVRAALDEINDYGRPQAVRLAVLVDRGRRELPIQADVVGKKIQTSSRELVEVGFTETDDANYVRLLERANGGNSN